MRRWSLSLLGLTALLCSSACLTEHLSPPPPPEVCESRGVVVQLGEWVTSVDGCNSCLCEAGGLLSCTTAACLPPPPLFCSFDGRQYAPGALFDAGDGCNTCRCEGEGVISCTEMACPKPGCDYEGQHMEVGEALSPDGCNECVCTPSGRLRCTMALCQEGCSYDGDWVPVGASFQADGCATCSCLPGGLLDCVEVGCDLPDGCDIEEDPLTGFEALTDCAGDSSLYVAECSGETELHVISIYQSNPGAGPVAVALERSDRPLVLVLAAFADTTWQLSVSDDVALEQVIVTGEGGQRLRGLPRGVPVVNLRSRDDFRLAGCSHQWNTRPGSERGCDGAALTEAVEEHTGLRLSSFHGCELASEFTLFEAWDKAE